MSRWLQYPKSKVLPSRKRDIGQVVTTLLTTSLRREIDGNREPSTLWVVSQRMVWTLLSFQPIEWRPVESVSSYSGRFAPILPPKFFTSAFRSPTMDFSQRIYKGNFLEIAQKSRLAQIDTPRHIRRSSVEVGLRSCGLHGGILDEHSAGSNERMAGSDCR